MSHEPHALSVSMDQLGMLVRAERQRRGLTQAALATCVRTSRATISGIEQGTLREVGLHKVEAILDALGYALIIKPRGRLFSSEVW